MLFTLPFHFCLGDPFCDNQSSYKNFRMLTEIFTSKMLSSLAFALKFFRPRRKKMERIGERQLQKVKELLKVSDGYKRVFLLLCTLKFFRNKKMFTEGTF